MAAIVLAVAFIGGVPLSPMLGDRRSSPPSPPSAFVFSTEYRYQRFTAFLDITGHRDHLSYQTYQGFLSIADGGLTGSGVGAGNGKLGYLPLAHSDFIFAVIADELGLVGVGRRDRRLHAARRGSASRPRCRRPTASACCWPAASRPGSACRR